MSPPKPVDGPIHNLIHSGAAPTAVHLAAVSLRRAAAAALCGANASSTLRGAAPFAALRGRASSVSRGPVCWCYPWLWRTLGHRAASRDGSIYGSLRATDSGSCSTAIAVLLLTYPSGEAHAGQLPVVAGSGASSPPQPLPRGLRRRLHPVPAAVSSGSSCVGGPGSGNPLRHTVVADPERVVAGHLRRDV